VKSAANATPGVIETLTGGFEQVNRIPWIVGLPIVIDVALWLAPPLTAGAVIHSFIGSLTDLYGTIAANGACTGAPSAVSATSATVWPAVTRSPRFTNACASEPAPCFKANITDCGSSTVDPIGAA